MLPSVAQSSSSVLIGLINAGAVVYLLLHVAAVQRYIRAMERYADMSAVTPAGMC